MKQSNKILSNGLSLVVIIGVILGGKLTASAQAITVTSLAGGEAWVVSSTHTIKWTSIGDIAHVKILYSKDDFISDTHTIADDVINTGIRSWTIPDDITPDNRVKVRVESADNPGIYDDSEGFKIRADIKITSPVVGLAGDPDHDDQSNEGDYPGLQWVTNRLHDITWQITGTVPSIVIECIEEGISKTTVTTTTVIASIGSHEWQVFDFTTMENYYPVTVTVRITDERDSLAWSESDAFNVCYYKIIWSLIDDVTGQHLKALSVQCDQSGWTELWISSPKTKYYPYGQYGPTKWMKTGYLETAEEDWWADGISDNFTMRMESSIIHSWQIMADFNYNTTYHQLETTSWFMRDGLLLTEPEAVSMDIYDQVGNFIKTLQSNNPDVKGVFRMIWYNPSLDPQQSYWVYVTLTYAGKPFKSGLTFDIDSESGDIHSWQTMAHFNYNDSLDRLKVTSWLLRDGLILNNPDGVRIDIYDHAGVLIKVLESSSPDSNGVFRMTWDQPGLDQEQTYSGYVTINYASSPYKGLVAHNFATDTREVIITGSSGDGSSKDWRCFIATAAYGTPMAQEIDTLREFRDKYLLSNEPGKILVQTYYRVSPPIARVISRNETLRTITKIGLRPIIKLATFVDDLGDLPLPDRQAGAGADRNTPVQVE